MVAKKKGSQEQLKKGTTIDALVLNIDKVQKKFSLSIKRLKEDPWKGVSGRYSVGDVVEGHITSITDFGVFVEIEEGVEGLIHVSEMDELQGKQPSEAFTLDDKIQAAVLNIDEKDKRIALSTKVLRKRETKTVSEVREESGGAFSTLGDILEPAMKKNSENTD